MILRCTSRLGPRVTIRLKADDCIEVMHSLSSKGFTAFTVSVPDGVREISGRLFLIYVYANHLAQLMNAKKVVILSDVDPKVSKWLIQGDLKFASEYYSFDYWLN